MTRRVATEALGTALLLIAVVGSGIVADRLTTDDALTLAMHAVVVGVTLAVLVLVAAPRSGAHLNPAVTLAIATGGTLKVAHVAGYITGQMVGALVGVVVANLMFGLPAVSVAATAREGVSVFIGELVAAFGLLAVVWGTAHHYSTPTVATAIGAYITAAIVFTSSGSFANPAVTAARALTDTFTGIAPGNVAPFIAAQLAGALGATMLFRWLRRPVVDPPIRE